MEYDQSTLRIDFEKKIIIVKMIRWYHVSSW